MGKDAKGTPLKAGLTFEDVLEAAAEAVAVYSYRGTPPDDLIDIPKLRKALAAPEPMPKFNVSVSFEAPVYAKNSEDAAKIAMHIMEWLIAGGRRDILEGAKISVKEAV